MGQPQQLKDPRQSEELQHPEGAEGRTAVGRGAGVGHEIHGPHDAQIHQGGSENRVFGKG